MDITYLGHSAFRIKTKNHTIVTDPYNSSIGLKFPKTEADLVTVSHDHFDHNDLSGLKDYKKVFNSPGEYEIGGVSVFGIPSFHDNKKGEERGKNTIFVIETEGVTICHLGDLGHLLAEDQIDEIGDVDILLVPVGGTYTISAKEAVDVVQAIDPKIIIPMHYKLPGLKVDIESCDKFIKEMGNKKEGVYCNPNPPLLYFWLLRKDTSCRLEKLLYSSK